MKTASRIAISTLAVPLLLAGLASFSMPSATAQAADGNTAKWTIRHAPSKMCLGPHHTDPEGRRNNNPLMLRRGTCGGADANYLFERLASGAVRHVKSGKCIHPKGGSRRPGNNTLLVLHDGCDGERLVFQQQSRGIAHRTSGKCFHPFGGDYRSRYGLFVVLHDGCKEWRLQFGFYRVK